MHVIKKGSAYLFEITWPGKSYHKRFTEDIKNAVRFETFASAARIADPEENEKVEEVSKWI